MEEVWAPEVCVVEAESEKLVGILGFASIISAQDQYHIYRAQDIHNGSVAPSDTIFLRFLRSEGSFSRIEFGSSDVRIIWFN